MSQLTALILAGGRATRMDGQDKGLLRIGHETFVSRLTRVLAPQVQELMINANRNIERYAETGFPIIQDTMPDFQGPLAGMLAGLESMSTEWLLTLPCDGPFVAPDYAARMLANVDPDKHPLAVASDGHRIQPVYVLLHRSLKHSLIEFLDSGERKIDRWYGQHNYATVEFTDYPRMFTNVNTPEELADLGTEATPQTSC